jgi:hypothetical protein
MPLFSFSVSKPDSFCPFSPQALNTPHPNTFSAAIGAAQRLPCSSRPKLGSDFAVIRGDTVHDSGSFLAGPGLLLALCEAKAF